MKIRVFIAFVTAVFLIAGCSGLDTGGIIVVGGAECTVCEDIMPTEASYICDLLKNPCTAYGVVRFSTEQGAIWDVYKIDDAIEWLDEEIRPKLSIEWTPRKLKLFILAQIGQFNKKAQGMFFSVGKMVAVFDSDQPFYAKDLKLLNMALDGIIADLKEMKEILGTLPPDTKLKVTAVDSYDYKLQLVGDTGEILLHMINNT